jgi:ubiquinone biosynthesis protein
MVSIVHAARDIGRIRDVTRVLVRHGFGEIVHRLGLTRARKRDGKRTDGGDAVVIDEPAPEEEERGARERREKSGAMRARMVLEDLGPSFVKLGQIASTRADILPPDVITELKKLQDAVPPVPFEVIRDQVERSVGAELADIYESFDPVPLAAASIAQVHRAELKTEQGLRDVVVKVQRPGIAQTIASDLDILHMFATLVERTIPESRIYSPVGLVQQFDRAITSELDFTMEADNAARFAKNFEGQPSVKFPHVYRQASTKHVITLEYLDGKKVYDAIAAGHSGKKIARTALEAIIKQIYDDGFFHADPHPGNVLVLGDPESPVLAMIDLGMVGRLSPRMRDLAVDVMVAAVRRDYESIADAMYALGTPTKKIDMHAYRAEVAMLAEKYLGRKLKDIELSAMIRDLIQGASKYGIEIPTDFVLVGKALMTIEGVGKEIDPDLDIFEDAKPLFIELLKKRYSPERLGNDLIRRIERLTGATTNMPEQLQEVLEDLRRGRLQIQVADPNLRTSADRLGQRIHSGLVSGALVVAGALLVANQRDIVGGVLFGAAALWLFWHSVLEVYRSLFQKR